MYVATPIDGAAPGPWVEESVVDWAPSWPFLTQATWPFLTVRRVTHTHTLRSTECHHSAPPPG
eukprot:1397934-Prymnesium_polylepis.1